ncbi:MAG: peptide-methionine (S)-S-oxide reductase MsrA [Spirochaetia bacterium]
MEKAYFAAGCFWGVQAAFDRIPGVEATTVGYSGGTVENPSYEQVCSGNTGHAETVEVVYNEEEVSLHKLTDYFWTIHNPYSVNHQGPDVGTQYRSAIFYLDEDQKKQALASKSDFEEEHAQKGPVATEITEFTNFYPAEEYHQKYFQQRGISACGV